MVSWPSDVSSNSVSLRCCWDPAMPPSLCRLPPPWVARQLEWLPRAQGTWQSYQLAYAVSQQYIRL